MSADYYVLIGETEEGPFTITQLKEMIRRGELSRETFYCRPGWNEWQKLDDLFDLVAAASPLGIPRREVFPAVSPVARPIPAVKEKKPMGAGQAIGIGCLTIVVLFIGGTMLLAIIGSWSKDPSDPHNMDFDAYYTAGEFAKKTYPGLTKVSGYHDSLVQHEGSTYTVALTVDGLNSFGGPIRKTVGVEMDLVGKTWTLKNIQQR